jgi:hypothetical protein
MTFDEEDGRIWQPGHDEVKLVAGGDPEIFVRAKRETARRAFRAGLLVGALLACLLALLVRWLGRLI